MTSDLEMTMLGACPGCEATTRKAGVPVPAITWAWLEPVGPWRMVCPRHGEYQTAMDCPPGADLFAPASEGTR